MIHHSFGKILIGTALIFSMGMTAYADEVVLGIGDAPVEEELASSEEELKSMQDGSMLPIYITGGGTAVDSDDELLEVAESVDDFDAFKSVQQITSTAQSAASSSASSATETSSESKSSKSSGSASDSTSSAASASSTDSTESLLTGSSQDKENAVTADSTAEILAIGSTAAPVSSTSTTVTTVKTVSVAASTTVSISSPSGSSSSSGSSSGVVKTTASRQAIISYARQFLGNPYVYGGTSLTEGADCSGFVQQIFKKFGITTGRSSRDQYEACSKISESQLQPGDLVFYASGDYVNHVAIYAGEGIIIHAANSRTGIITSSMRYREPYGYGTFIAD